MLLLSVIVYHRSRQVPGTMYICLLKQLEYVFLKNIRVYGDIKKQNYTDLRRRNRHIEQL